MKSSVKQSSQMDMSGDISVDLRAVVLLFTMENALNSLTGSDREDTSVICASGGGCSVRLLQKESMFSGDPST